MDYNTKSRNELLAVCKEKGIRGYTHKSKRDLIALLTSEPVTTVTIEKNKSPLRYPGGKTRAITILERYVNTYYPDRRDVLSPFFGGGSFELHMRANGCRVRGNDLFHPLYTFWSVLQSRCDDLITAIRAKMPVTKESFLAMRSTILTTTDEVEKAAMYFCINRSSFSGATLCGGFSQQAATGRLTDSSLATLKRCNVADVSFTNMDCCTFLQANPQTTSTLVFADPPYYINSYIYGKDGDMHESFNHAAFATALRARSDWILTYNDCPYIRSLYEGCRIFKESWSYGMNASKESSEIIILPPAEQE